MKFLVASDIHGSLRAANYIVDLDKKYDFSRIFLLGDLNYNGARNDVPKDYSPKKVTEKLNSLASKIVACKGNCESDVDLMVYDFPMPIFNNLIGNNMAFFLTHGDDEKLIVKDLEENEFSLFGHTHIPVLKKNENNSYIINPGSMTFPKGKLDKSFVIIDDGDISLFEFDYDEKDNPFVKKIYKINDL